MKLRLSRQAWDKPQCLETKKGGAFPAGNTIPSDHVIDATIVQGATKYTWTGYRFSQFSGWISIFREGTGTIILKDHSTGEKQLTKSNLFEIPVGMFRVLNTGVDNVCSRGHGGLQSKTGRMMFD